MDKVYKFTIPQENLLFSFVTSFPHHHPYTKCQKYDDNDVDDKENKRRSKSVVSEWLFSLLHIIKCINFFLFYNSYIFLVVTFLNPFLRKRKRNYEKY